MHKQRRSSAPRAGPISVGLTSGHGEQLTPDTPDFSKLFQALEGWSCALRPLPAPLSADALEGLEVLIVAAPAASLSGVGSDAIRRWVHRGGRLLVLGPHPETDAVAVPAARRTDLGGLAGLAFELSGGVVGGLAGPQAHFGVGRFLPSLQVRHDGHIVRFPAGSVWCPPSGSSLTRRGGAGIRERKLLARKRALWRAIPVPAGAAMVTPHERDGVRLNHTGPVEDGLLYAALVRGDGQVHLLGGPGCLRDDMLAHAGNLAFFEALLADLLPRRLDEALRRRMARPQRHRLLQGYPMAPVMAEVDADEAPAPMDPWRPLVLGVLPHAGCNPTVSGCGFCTFPHEDFELGVARAVVQRVQREVEQTVTRHPELSERRVEALYFGGGTANLTPHGDLSALCERLRAAFRLDGAEVTLEGVPVYFKAADYRLLDCLQEALPGCEHRLSMGVQTFDPQQLERMGRTRFGSREQLDELVKRAHDRGFSVSADLLFNLPGQTLPQMLDDIAIATELGFDQLCLYHLVLFEGLGTAWSEDPALLGALPDNEAACENWLALRERMTGLGYWQRTLTNFERRGAAGFRYEPASFSTHYDALGFGPAAITTFVDVGFQRVSKWMNHPLSAPYLRDMDAHGGAVARRFRYDERDRRVLYLTRRLALKTVPLAEYESLFGAPPSAHFPGLFERLLDAGLMENPNGESLQLTPRGMFYADAVAGLLAWPAVLGRMLSAPAPSPDDDGALAFDLHVNNAGRHHMG